MELSEASASLIYTNTVYLPHAANEPISSKYTFTASGSLIDCLSTLPSFGLLISNVTCVVSTPEPSPPTLLQVTKKNMSSAAAPKRFKRALGKLSRRAGMLEAMHIAAVSSSILDFFSFDQS